MVEESNSNKFLITQGKKDPEGNPLPPHIYKNLLDILLWLVWSKEREAELPKERPVSLKNNYERKFCRLSMNNTGRQKKNHFNSAAAGKK